MKFRRHRTLVKRVALGLAVAAIAAPAAQAQFPESSSQAKTPSGESAQYLKALELRSQALNERYGLGSAAVPDAVDRYLANSAPQLDGSVGRPAPADGVVASATSTPIPATPMPVSKAGPTVLLGAPQHLPFGARGGPVRSGILVRQPVTATTTDGSFGSDDAIGLGAVAGIALLAGGMALAFSRRGKPAMGV